MFNNKFSGFFGMECVELSIVIEKIETRTKINYFFTFLERGISRESFIALTRCHDC